jgi:hypothetical protein
MKIVKSTLLILILALGAGVSVASSHGKVAQASPAARRTAAFALVSDLYRQHGRNRGPFFQTRSRSLLTKYFTRDLADRIWKDRVTSNAKQEVGALDGDPLYNAQDAEIKNLKIHPAELTDEGARVLVTFSNFGQNQKLDFLLLSGPAGWRIANIEYQDGTSLLGILKGT